ncbi:hypothetical protein CY35_03G028600 [Sphagnum magellanicum]|nr:hypothetical protein CY35_03G028600 [Sphagnum magellanicum]
MDAWCGSLQSTTNSGTTGNSRRESRTNDGVMAVLTSTHMQASVASQLSPSQSAVYSSPPLGQLSVGMPGTLSTVSSQPSPTLLQHQQHQITSASSNLCHHVLVRGIISSWVGSLSLQSYIYLVLQSGLQDCVIPLPKPLTVAEADKGEGQVLENGKKSHEDLPSPEVTGGAHATDRQIQAMTSNAFAQ